MLKDFQEHIHTHFPILEATPFLIACSGGIDSMVLLDLCQQAKLTFGIAHCNFHLREEESNEDEAFLKQYAQHHNIPCYIKGFDTVSYGNQHKLNTQLAARELRYKWFLQLLQEYNYSKILTAHHADDNLETFLINLSRGSGIEGLTGIPEQTTTLARPLLPFSRAQIVSYAKERAIEWREDRSNKETKYVRNKIRHKIVPLLKEIEPNFLNQLSKSQTFLQQSADIAQRKIQEEKHRLFKEDGATYKIEVAALKKLKPLDGYLFGFFREYGFTEWSNVKTLLDAESGKEIYSKTHRLVKDRTHVILHPITIVDTDQYPIGENETVISVPIAMTINHVEAITHTASNILYIDQEALKYPLVVRKWKEGDYFYPFGMKGKKKLSKYFKDEKIDVVAKSEQWILCSGDAIVWVIGKRADDRFKVTPTTNKILKLEVNQ